MARSSNGPGTWGSKNTSDVPGPFDERAKRVGPVFDLSHTAPVNERFGYSLSASHADQLFQVNFANSNWDLVKHYVEGFTLSQSPQRRVSSTAAGTVDYKLGERSVFGGKISYAGYNAETAQYELIATHQGGSGDATFSESNGNRGRVTLRTRNTPINNQTWHGGLNYRYTGDPWKVRGSAYYSSATSDRGNIDDGGLTDITAQNFNIYTRFEGIGRDGPTTISSRNAAGNRIELPDVATYTLTSASDTRAHGLAVKSGAELDATRELDFSVPASIRSGLYYNGQKRDRKFTTNNYTFLGPDRVANNADNRVGLYDFINERSVPGDFGLETDRFVSGPKFTEHFRRNPDQFTESTPAVLHTNRVSGSSEITESVTAAYVRGDVRLATNRLWVVGGVRWERTEDEGYGPLNDPGATYQRDANGNIVRDSAGRPVRKTTDAYELALLQFKERGAYAKRAYNGYYPSLNLTYNLTDNVLLRAAYARTIGRPGFSNIIPGVTISDPDALDPRITVNNTGLKPWQADGYDLAAEWYFGNNGLFSAGVFRRDTKDFFGGLILPATTALLESYGLDDSYLNYDISTRTNVGDARVTGLEFSYRQALTFLPHWARGIQVFANATLLDLKGSAIADFTGYSERDLSWGISLSRPRYAVRLNWSANGEVRGNPINASATVPPDTYFFTPRRTVLDASVEVRLTPRIALYAAARNLLNAPDIRMKQGPGIPDFAQTERYVSPGFFSNFGIKGEF